MPAAAGGFGILYFVFIIFSFISFLIFLSNIALFFASIFIHKIITTVVENSKISNSKKIKIKKFAPIISIVLFVLSIVMFVSLYNFTYLSGYNLTADLSGFPRLEFYPFGCENLGIETDDKVCKEENYCFEINNSSRDPCFSKFAVSKKNPLLCENIGSQHVKDTCFRDVSGVLKDISLCEKIENQNFKDQCYEQTT